MKIIKNEKLIQRNAKIGKYTNLAGLIVMFGSVFFAFQFMTNPDSLSSTNSSLIIGVMFVGFVTSWIGSYFNNRWGRRPDEALDKALKGMPGDYSFYHYTAPVAHLLVGPAGIWILLPYFLQGIASYRKNRWHISGGGFFQSYIRFFGQESIGRPDLEAANEIATLEKQLGKNLEEGEELPPIQAALVFLGERIEVQAGETPMPAMQVKKLKEFMRKTAKEKSLSAAESARIKAMLPGEADFPVIE